MPTEAEAKMAAKGAGSEILHILEDYVLPVAGVGAGYLTGSAIWGGQTLSNTLWASAGGSGSTNGKLSGTTVNRLVSLGIGAFSGGIGYSLWRLGKRDGHVMKLVFKPAGAFFVGNGVSYIVGGGILGNSISNSGGVFDLATNFIQNIAGGK